MEKTDLSKLKEEISKRKSIKQDANGNNIKPKDVILNGLLESLNSGRETVATQKIKMVTNEAAVKKSEPIVYKDVNKTNTPNVNQRQQIPINENIVDNSGDRDMKFYDEVDKLSKKFNNKNSLLNYNQPEQQTYQGTPVLNEEVVKKVITNNFSHLIDEALKDSIIKIYTEEHIRDILSENEYLIKKVVINTLKEISKKTRKK